MSNSKIALICLLSMAATISCGKKDNPLLNDNAIISLVSIINQDKSIKSNCRRYYVNPLDPTKSKYREECDNQTRITYNKYKNTELFRSANLSDLRDQKLWERFYQLYPLADLFG